MFMREVDQSLARMGSEIVYLEQLVQKLTQELQASQAENAKLKEGKIKAAASSGNGNGTSELEPELFSEDAKKAKAGAKL